jgi:hypothetical protein
MEGLAETLFRHTEGTSGKEVARAPEKWGPVPDDAHETFKALHYLTSSIYGDGLQCGLWKPKWNAETDDDFIADEEKRRELPRGVLVPFLNVPYMEPMTTVEYTTGKQKPGGTILFGNGEKFGECDAYFLLYPTGVNANSSLTCGNRVLVGDGLWCKEVTLARILRTTKPAKAGAKQQCFYALLDTGAGFEYAPLQQVSALPKGHRRSCGTLCCQWESRSKDADPDWDEEDAFDGYTGKRYGTKLATFTPKSVSVVARAAPLYVSSLNPEHSKSHKKARSA